MNSTQDLINQALEGLPVTDEQKHSLLGFYYLAMYKTVLELLIGIRGQQADFYKNLDTFLEEIIMTLSPEEKKHFETVLEGQKAKILQEMVFLFRENVVSSPHPQPSTSSASIP